MARAKLFFLFLALGLATGGCTRGRPPAELAGLWSAGPAACAAGVGVEFRAGEIAAIYDDQAETLFRNPRYAVQASADGRFRVRVTYDLPRPAGGAHSAGAYGVLMLARQPGGAIAPEAHNLIDGRTGAARLRVRDDPATALLTLEPCGEHPWRQDLRGRSAA